MSIDSIIDSRALIITLKDGENGNRLHPALLKDLQLLLNQHKDNQNIRFVMLRSNGPNFCLGMDLISYSQMSNTKDVLEFKDSVTRYSNLLELIHTYPKTVVALIEGPVKAGGVGLVAACDIVVATENVSFELSELYFGLIPANVMPYLLSLRMPLKKTAYLVQSAACIDAQQAYQWGLVDEIYPKNSIEKAMKNLGKRLMRISPQATALQKSLTAKLSRANPSKQRKLAIDTLIDLATETKVIDAIKQYTEGELPEWFNNFKPKLPLSISK